jgi:hypothetical protein
MTTEMKPEPKRGVRVQRLVSLPPKRIYLQWYGSSGPMDGGEVEESEVSWCATRVFRHDFVYVRLKRKRKAG